MRLTIPKVLVLHFPFCLLAIFLSLQSASARLDQNSNGLSDVWEWSFSATGLDPNADADGDGFSNLQEALAGTDPFDVTSFPHITVGAYVTNQFTVSLPSVLGKQYQLQSIDSAGGTNWVNETNIVSRTGTNVTLSVATAAAARFYRVAISDVDTDGDGLTDWEEYQLGLNPTNAFSNNQQDLNGNAMSDSAFAQAQIVSQNVLSVTASIPAATQPDAGQDASLSGQFTISRSGFPLGTIVVNLAPGGPGKGFATAGVDYTGLPPAVVLPDGVNSQDIILTPMANTNLQAPVFAQLKLLPGSNYSLGTVTNASVLIFPSPTPTGTGLLGKYYTNSSTTYTSNKNFNATNLFLVRTDAVIDFNWTNGTSPNLSNAAYSVRWTGQVQPQYSETYFFDVKSDDGCKLWVNDQLIIDKWASQSLKDQVGSIALQAGTLYDIQLEYMQVSGAAQAHLYWYSPSQPQVLIPSSALYPTNRFVSGASNAVAAVTSPMSAVAFLGQFFSFAVTAANTPLGYTATNLPPGLAFNSVSGLISGVPTAVGSFFTTVTASNKVGVGASVVNITVLNTGSSVVQEIWTNVAGTNISDIPTSMTASITNVLGALEGNTDYGDNYGERVRGFFTAPTTGNYYFWIAGSNSAQLWISNDSDPVNKVLRATAKGSGSRQWAAQTAQASPWLTMVAGQKYYLEVLHKAGVGAGDNWSVGWRQDATGTNTTPGTVLPGYLLSRYYPPLPVTVAGTLYSANLLALPGVNSQGVGSASLRVNQAGTSATLNFEISNLKGTVTGEAVDSDPYLLAPDELVYDISAAHQQPDGSYSWAIKAAGPLSAADVLEIIREGKAYIIVQTTAFPNGEIAGHFVATEGSQTFTPPPAPPAWTDDSANTNAAVRFLTQSTFGASTNDIALVRSIGYSNWITQQFALAPTLQTPYVRTHANSDPTQPFRSELTFNSWWQQAVTAPDQLRQRVAFALSEIFVVSENSSLVNHADSLSTYYDVLVTNAFGNYRTLLEDVTLHPAMGRYLSMLANNAGSIATGIHADENYAREIQQLFSIGLNRMWPDGTLILNAQGNLVPTYNQNVIMGFASVFTGWHNYQTNQASGRLPSNFNPASNYTNNMVLVPSHHEVGTKLLIDNVMLPAAQGAAADSTQTNYDNYGLQELQQALNTIFNSQNIGPFICRQLIQRLVTSNPSRNYVYRVAQVFNDDGTGVRGNLQAVVKAILLDYEARSPDLISQPGYGKQREPLLRVTQLARAFPPPAPISGTYSETTNQAIKVTTATPHRLGSGDTVWLTFTDTSGHAAPPAQGYSTTVLDQTNFTVNSPQLLTGTYGQTNGVITLAIGSTAVASNYPVYLMFTTGGASNGLYNVASIIDSSHFTVATADLTLKSGSCLFPKVSAGGYTQTGTQIVISTTGPHGLLVGNNVFLNFTLGSAVDGTYAVSAVPDTSHFIVTATNSVNQNQNGVNVYPLVASQITRSGTVVMQQNTWGMNATDSGTTSSLMETPMSAPTVFNFYYPEYQFPGALASAGLTTPEFQLTTDTGVAAQINFLEGALLNNTGNTNGLSSFNGGNGSIVMDISPWMTTNYTTNSGISNLVVQMNTLLAAGQVSAAGRAAITSFVANTNNLTYSTPPTYTQMRDRVRSVIHLLVNSPDYIIQK